jgi:hypothetical protein
MGFVITMSFQNLFAVITDSGQHGNEPSVSQLGEIDVGLRATFKDGHRQHFVFKNLPPTLRLPFAASNNWCQ